MLEEVNEELVSVDSSRTISPRERREQEQVDLELRKLINELLNSRMEDPEATKDKVDELEKKWFSFCIKPRKVGLMGSTWKKIKPNKEAFRVKAMDFIKRFDEALKEQQEVKPITEEEKQETLNYKFK